MCYRLLQRLIKLLLWVLFGLKVYGRQNVKPDTVYLVAANHLSYLDPPLLGSVMPQKVFYLAKSELFKNKLFGLLIKILGAVPLKRGTADTGALRQAIGLLKNGQSMAIFPEGSRSSFTAKPGVGLIANATGTQVLPVYIKNQTELRACLLRKKRLTVFIGTPIDPQSFNPDDQQTNKHRAFAEYVLKAINELNDER